MRETEIIPPANTDRPPWLHVYRSFTKPNMGWQLFQGPRLTMALQGWENLNQFLLGETKGRGCRGEDSRRIEGFR